METQQTERKTETVGELLSIVINELGGLLLRGIFILVIAGAAFVLLLRLAVPITICGGAYLALKLMFGGNKKT